MNKNEIDFLLEAANFFQNPGRVIRGLNWLGGKIDETQKLLPPKIQNALSAVVTNTLQKAISVTLRTVPAETIEADLASATKASKAKGYLHSAAAVVTGGASGFFGLEAALIELPVSTMVMMRSIAETGREFGEDMSDPSAALQCLLVLTLGAPSQGDQINETAYYAARMSLGTIIGSAATFVAANRTKAIASAIENKSAPELIRLLAHVAKIFELQVSKKFLAKAVPIIGAVGGASVNATFSEFYNKAARYHFGIRKLERKYGESAVKKKFDVLTQSVQMDKLPATK